VASGDDGFDLLHTAPSSVTTISAMTHNGDCPPCGSPALLLGDSPARALNPVVDSTTATTPVPVLDDRAATVGWMLGRLSPIPGAEFSCVCMLLTVCLLFIASAVMAALLPAPLRHSAR